MVIQVVYSAMWRSPCGERKSGGRWVEVEVDAQSKSPIRPTYDAGMALPN